MRRQLSPITQPFFALGILLYLILLSFINYPLTTIFKPLPIALLMLFTLYSQANGQTKALLLTALGYSFLGDLVLTLPLKSAMEGGVVLFMLAHCAYIFLYFKDFEFQKKRLLLFIPLLTLIIVSFHYLWPYFGSMARPVTVYTSLLTLMVFLSFHVKQQVLLIGGGACLFLLCDLIFAINQFAHPGSKALEIAITLIYYLAQSLLVLGLSQRIAQSNRPPLKETARLKLQS